MDRQCNEAEGARLLETMRKICDTTGCQEVEHATLAYEETLQEKKKKGEASLTKFCSADGCCIFEERKS